MWGYDRAFAHPVGSFIVPVTPPNVEPDEGSQVSVCFAEEWLPFVLGALSQLQLQSTWKSDDPTEILTAQSQATALMGLFSRQICAHGIAPYWDQEDGSDLEGDPSEGEGAPWYFALVDPDETLQANLENWFLGAFVAEIAGFPSALAFLTIAKKFRLAWKTGDWGGIVELFIDGTHVGDIDTYSPVDGIKTMDIIIPDA